MKIKNIFLQILLFSFIILPQNSLCQYTELELEEQLEEDKIDEDIEEEHNEHHDSREMITYFNELNWKKELSPIDIARMNSALDFSDYRYKEMEANIMAPVLTHRIYSIENRQNLYRWEEYRKYLKETKKITDAEFDDFLLSNIRTDKLKKNNARIRHYRSIDDQLLNVLVIRQSKLLRNGKEQTVNFDSKILSSFHKNILEQGKFTTTKAIQNLTTKIANLGIVLSEKEYEILEALSSYGKDATLNTFEIVTDSIALKKFSQRGKRLMLHHLMMKAKIDLTKKEQLELAEFLNKEEVYNRIFNKQKYLIANIISTLTGEDIELCMKRIGISFDKEKTQ